MTQQVSHIETSLLDFDPENPRFYRLNDRHSEEIVIDEMLNDESVQDLMLSIGEKNYFPGEPLLVVEDGDRYTVIEGNRRLAAVKLLNGQLLAPKRRARTVASILAEANHKPTTLPVLIYETRKEILRYLGYRHITGIKEWDSLSKAKYLAELRDEFYSDLPLEEQMRVLAKDIGSRSDYVAQLLAALNLYEKASEEDFFGLPIQPKDVEFSYVTTALSYRNIASWLGLEDRKDIEMEGLDEGNLKNIFSWMFAKDQQGRTILGESRKLTELSDVVARPDAVTALIESKSLSEAYLFTDGPQMALEKALAEVLSKTDVIWKMIRKAEFNEGHLDQANELFDTAKLVRNTIRDRLEGE